jgi:hypothetical protein
MMTSIDKLVEMARIGVRRCIPGTPEYSVCGRVLDRFDNQPSLPCGHTVKSARDKDGSYIEIDGDTMDLESAAGFALAILREIDQRRAADAAEESGDGE